MSWKHMARCWHFISERNFTSQNLAGTLLYITSVIRFRRRLYLMDLLFGISFTLPEQGCVQSLSWTVLASHGSPPEIKWDPGKNIVCFLTDYILACWCVGRIYWHIEEPERIVWWNIQQWKHFLIPFFVWYIYHSSGQDPYGLWFNTAWLWQSQFYKVLQVFV